MANSSLSYFSNLCIAYTKKLKDPIDSAFLQRHIDTSVRASYFYLTFLFYYNISLKIFFLNKSEDFQEHF